MTTSTNYSRFDTIEMMANALGLTVQRATRHGHRGILVCRGQLEITHGDANSITRYLCGIAANYRHTVEQACDRVSEGAA